MTEYLSRAKHRDQWPSRAERFGMVWHGFGVIWGCLVWLGLFGVAWTGWGGFRWFRLIWAGLRWFGVAWGVLGWFGMVRDR